MITTTTTGIITIIMTDADGLYRLTAWTSPSFPTGAFSYSHGLEWAVEAGRVTNEADMRGWIEHCLANGVGRTDGALLAAGYRAAKDDARLDELIDLAGAWRATSETALESAQPGAAFLTTVRAAWPSPALDHFAALCGDRKPGLALCFGVAAAEIARYRIVRVLRIPALERTSLAAAPRRIQRGNGPRAISQHQATRFESGPK